MISIQTLCRVCVCSFLLIVAVFSFTGCGNSHASTVSQAFIAPATTESTLENDKRFLLRAVEYKYEIILLSRLAQQRSMNEEVKSLAKTLEEANRADKSVLASLGITKSIQIPTAPGAAETAAYDSLSVATEAGFDQRYIQYVIEGYSSSISFFEGAAHQPIDAEIKSKAAAMIPGMRDQLQQATMLHTSLNSVADVVAVP